ncbi:MAG: hypothetical protein JKX76_12280 [Colwellia sp.]|nr:hypothetical protein [Colwellia sp.]
MPTSLSVIDRQLRPILRANIISSNVSAIFVGLETLLHSINGKTGNFVIQHDGKF